MFVYTKSWRYKKRDDFEYKPMFIEKLPVIPQNCLFIPEFFLRLNQSDNSFSIKSSARFL